LFHWLAADELDTECTPPTSRVSEIQLLNTWESPSHTGVSVIKIESAKSTFPEL